MSFSVSETWDGQSTGVVIEANGVKGTADVSRTFDVEADLPGRSTVEVLTANDLPRRNDPHPQVPALRARRFNVTQSAPRMFKVTVGYEAPTADPNDPAMSPLAQPASITVRGLTQQVEVDYAVDGRAIATINGEPIRGVTRPFTDLVITVRRNLPTFNFESISTYTNKTNSSPFLGFPAGTMRIADIQAQDVFADDFIYWDVSIEFQVRRGFGPVTDERAWWYRAPHVGYWVKDDDTGVLVQAMNAGQKVSQPVFIILEGADAGFRELDPTVGHFIEFQVLETIDFNQLNLL